MATYGNPMILGAQASSGGGNIWSYPTEWRYGTYTGNGSSMQRINLEEKPQDLFVAAINMPPLLMSGSSGIVLVYQSSYFSACFPENHLTGYGQMGIGPNGAGFLALFTTATSPPNARRAMLNESNKTYVFKYLPVQDVQTTGDLPIGSIVTIQGAELPGGNEFFVVAQNHYGQTETLLSAKNPIKDRTFKGSFQNGTLIDYENSDIDKFLSGEYLEKIPANLKSKLKEVSIGYTTAQGSTYSSKQISRKVFIPAVTEIYGQTDRNKQEEGITSLIRNFAEPYRRADGYHAWSRSASELTQNMAYQLNVEKGELKTSGIGLSPISQTRIYPMFSISNEIKVSKNKGGTYSLVL